MLQANLYGGVVNGTMQQGAEESYAAINFDKQTAEGACWALSVMWLAFQSTSTGVWADYFAWIKKPSGIKMMNNTQVEMSRRKGAGESSKLYLREWLSKQSFLIDDSVDHTEIDWPATAAGVAPLTTPPGYKFINLQFTKGGHAIACHGTANSVIFFDPNFGQATFASPANFQRWMVDKLLDYYDTSLGLAWFRITNVSRTIGVTKPIG